MDATIPRTATVQLTPRQWTRIMLDPCAVLSQPTTNDALFLLQEAGESAGLLPVTTTTREAALITALLRDYQTRGY